MGHSAPDSELHADCAAIGAAIAKLLPEIAERAAEIEAARRIPADLVAKMRTAGCFAMAVPRRAGGPEFSIVERLRALEDIAAADGSAGWIAAIGSDGPSFFGLTSADVFADLYAEGPNVAMAGAVAPTGRALPCEGGYRVTGRWAWSSGCLHADWLIGNCILLQDSESRPLQRLMLFRPSEATFHDTWFASGLRGTGSCDFSVEDIFVPTSHAMDVWAGEPNGPEACVLPNTVTGNLVFAAVAIGVARGARDDVLALARTGKRRLLASADCAEQPIFQYRFGEADIKIRGARALLHEQAGRLEAAAHALPRGIALLHHPMQKETVAVGVSTTRMAAEALDALYAIAGGASVRESWSLQRRWRDVHAITQHAGLSDELLARHGAGLLGAGRPAARGRIS